jgi:hypothetical protein
MGCGNSQGGASMELKKTAPAVLIGFIVLTALNYLIHGVWLAPVYRDNSGVWRDAATMQHKMWVLMVGQFLFVLFFVWVYTRGVEVKSWVGQGIRYGILMSLLTIVPESANEYVVYPIPYTLVVKWIVAGGLELVILGLIVAGFCRKASPRSA